MRVYCPDCNALRKVPDHWVGQRVRCRKCDRAFRVGARNEPRGREDDPDDVDPVRHLTAAWVVVSVALLVAGLVVGGGMTAWYFVKNQPPPGELDEPDLDDPEAPGRPPPEFDRVPGDPN